MAVLLDGLKKGDRRSERNKELANVLRKDIPQKGLGIGIDVDDVLANTKEMLRRRVNKRYGTQLRFRDIRHPRLEKNITECHIPPHAIKGILSHMWDNFPSISLLDPKVPDIMSRLHEEHDLIIVTATDAKYTRLMKWLSMYSIPFDDIVHVSSSKQKLEATPHVDVYVDDYPEIIEGAINSDKMAVLIKQPWNKDFRKRIRKHRPPNLAWARMEHLEMRLDEVLRESPTI